MSADGGDTAQSGVGSEAAAEEFIRRPYTTEDLDAAGGRAAAGPRREAAAPPPAEDNGERLQRELALLVSPQMRDIQQVIQQAARADVTVLVCGETGVGKELVARAIHAHSRRHRGA